MTGRAALLGLAILVGTGLGAAPLRAAPVDVITTLTVDAVGTGSPFGISGLPAGPFTATLSFAGPLPASATLDSLAEATASGLQGFSLTIGNTSFGLADLVFVFLETDAAGIATTVQAAAVKPSGANVSFQAPPVVLNISWRAVENGCIFSGPPLGVDGVCLAGGPDSISFTQVARDPTAVAVPGALGLFGVALLGLAGAARRRT